MKKLVMICAVFLCIGFSAAAHSQFRIAGDAAADFVSMPGGAGIDYTLENPANFMSGFYWEVLHHSRVGFGNHYLARFSRMPSQFDYVDWDWWFDWNGDMFLSFHFFRVGRMVDPFVQVGYGCAGRVRMTEANENYWVQDIHGDWYYDSVYWNPDGDNAAVTNMSLYPFVAAGLALDLRGFLISARVAYRPFVHPVPGTQFDNYPLKNLQVALSAGIAFGGHRR